MPVSDAESIVDNCRDFTRRDIGLRVLRLSTKEILAISGGKFSHPLLMASIAHDILYDSPLKYDRLLPIEQRYIPMKRACGQVFRDMHEPPPTDEE